MRINYKSYKYFPILIIASLILSGCHQQDVKEEIPKKDALEVVGQTVKNSQTSHEALEFPAVISADQEAKIIAKTAGTASNVRFNVGDKVRIGDTLLKIDDINAGSRSLSNFNTSQIKQAQIGVAQAAANYQLAQTNYQNLLISSEKDLSQGDIVKNQTAQAQKNVNATIEEALKSAELAYESAKLAAQTAKLTLDNRQKLGDQSAADSQVNADLTAESVVNSCETSVENINNITALDPNKTVTISYKYMLGAMDSATLVAAKAKYLTVQNAIKDYRSKNFNSTGEKVDAAIVVVKNTKTLIDSVKIVLEKTITSADLPLNSLSGPSLSSLQSAVAGYQTQTNAALNQINAVKQGLSSVDLGNTTSLDSLAKAYEIAKKQEASALQNLNNLKAGNKTQVDQAYYGNKSAIGQYDSLKSRLDSQIAVSKSQVELARLQYSNAATGLQSLYDVHLAVTPIDGMITKKMVTDGDTVSAGQILAIVSQSEKIKLQFYVDQETFTYFKLGQSVKIKDNDENLYSAKITSLTPQADSLTRRFLVEVMPDKSNAKAYNLGTILSVIATIEKSPQKKGNLMIPVSAIEISQNGNYIFISQNDKATKIAVTIERVQGETAEISVKLAPETIIVIDGNKLLNEGDEISIKPAAGQK
jgi:multidrug efflux pump subunit AcrA (membrane-fusion protein)